MKILGIETASITCAAAVVENGQILAENSLTEPHIHSEKLIAIIDNVLTLSDGFDAIAVSIGPGSFTGLRIGLSVAKGLVYASGKPIVAVSTLEALANNLILNNKVNEGSVIWSLMDARRDEFYTAMYRKQDGELRMYLEPQALRFDVFLKKLSGDKINFVGDGSEKLQNLLQKRQVHKNDWLFYDRIINLCSAGSVALLGENKVLRNEFENLAELEPFYLKDFQTLVKTQHS
ncbi:MAG: tRNA (adenosine(37)-N6)-threonylcarbamoyltransferase complex dimerization subunit type 1 TsaB [Bacteroidota bacterium]|nr:tRNA (adenosine(37)-N6)-threonylcarbamoyltransferase complex dimerization subunit type 1 TsaB [Bacteroidota bacterium]